MASKDGTPTDLITGYRAISECRTDWQAWKPEQLRSSLDPHPPNCGCEGCIEDTRHRLDEIASEIHRLQQLRLTIEASVLGLDNARRLLLMGLDR